MDVVLFDRIKELIDEYGKEILNDPDRLSQFLEDSAAATGDQIFRFSFALHAVIRSGWDANTAINNTKYELYARKLCADLAFTENDAKKFLDTLQLLTNESNLSEDGAVIAHPGNLRRIKGGIANSPRTMWLRKKSIYNGIVLFVAFLAIIILFFQITAQRNPEDNEFKIAYFAPLSKDASQQWHRQLKASQLAVERINKQNGIRNCKLKVVGFDIPDNPAKTADKVEKIMKDGKFVVMLSGVSGKNAESLSKVADKIEVPLLLSSNTITENYRETDNASPYLYTFRISNTAAELSALMVYYAKSVFKSKKVAILHNESDAYSVEAAEAVRNLLRKSRCRIVVDLSYTNSEQDYTSALKTIGAAKADTLLLPGRTKNAANMLKQLSAAEYRGHILGANFIENNFAGGTACAKDSWWINSVSANDPQVLSLLNDYQKLFNETCLQSETASVVLTYDCVCWIAAALYRAPGYRGEAVRHGLLSTRNLSLTHATLTTDPKTHGPLNKACALIHVCEGKKIFQRRISLKTDL